jgi:hypothetical protein
LTIFTTCASLFAKASRPDAVERSADALVALTQPLFETLLPLVAEAKAERLIQARPVLRESIILAS